MKYCPECGVTLKFQNPKFCPECGASLSTNERIELETKEELNEKQLRISVFELGDKLEEVVEKIYRSKGYNTERRLRIEGDSGTKSEIDIIAKRGRKTIAIECKNYSLPVGIDKLRDFNQKLQDLRLQGVFIANSGFTQGAAQFAQSKNIETMDISELQEKWWAISIGRAQSVKGETLSVEYTLPMNVDFQQATNLDLANEEKIKIADAELIFHPYFAIEYSFKARFQDPTRKLHKFKDKDTVYVDALDATCINPMPERGLGLIKTVKNVVSAKEHTQNERTINLLKELSQGFNTITCEFSVEEDYHVNCFKQLVTPRQALKSSINYIIERNTRKVSYTPKNQNDSLFQQSNSIVFVPKRRDIRVISQDMIVIPRWSIEFEVCDRGYRREIFACSGTTVEDTIKYCPRHMKVGAIDIFSKKTIAVCEVCGQSLCEKHVRKCPACGKWLCSEDSIECSCCHNYFCHEHNLLSCSICDEPICNSCMIVCPICGGKYSPKHTKECSVCGISVCSNCVVNSGLVRRKKICKNCS